MSPGQHKGLAVEKKSSHSKKIVPKRQFYNEKKIGGTKKSENENHF